MGLSAEYGLTKQAKCINGEGTCNWWITEINNRPLNLSFKGNEVGFILGHGTPSSHNWNNN